MSRKSNLRLQKLIITILLSVIVIVISSCSSTKKQESIPKLDVSATPEVTVTPKASETLPEVETPTPEPTATATEIPTPTEDPYKNIGKFPLTLEREDIEENGLIIPFNPVDNPEEFLSYIKDIQRKGGLGYVKADPKGSFNPVSNITYIHGEIIRCIQVMFFEYEGKYFPVISPWGNSANLDRLSLLSDVWQYDNLSKNNVVGARVDLPIFRDIEKTPPGAIASQEMWDIAKITGISVIYLKEPDR